MNTFGLSEEEEGMEGDSGISVEVMDPPESAIESEEGALEKTISQTRINEQAARQAEIEAIRREQTALLKKAEEIERKHLGNRESIADLWDRAIKDVVKIHNQGRNINGFKKTVYDALKKVGVDMYKRDANRILSHAQDKANAIKEKLDYVHRRLHNDIGDKGLATLLKEQREIAVATANALAQSKKAEIEYTTEIYQKEVELQELRGKAKNDPKVDYTIDIEYVKSEIEKPKKELLGLREDIRKLSNKLNLYDAKIETKDAIVVAINMVYTKGTIAYTDLQSEIEMAREFINNGNLIDQGLGKAIVELESVIDMAGKLSGMESRMGETIVEGTRRIREQMGAVQGMNRDKQYRRDLKKESNEDEQQLSSGAEELIAKYATVPHS